MLPAIQKAVEIKIATQQEPTKKYFLELLDLAKTAVYVLNIKGITDLELDDVRFKRLNLQKEDMFIASITLIREDMRDSGSLNLNEKQQIDAELRSVLSSWKISRMKSLTVEGFFEARKIQTPDLNEKDQEEF